MLSNKKNVSNSSMHIFSNILFCLKFLYKNNKKLFFIRIPSTIILSLSNFISIIFVRYIINEITNGNSFFSVILYVLGMVITHLIINVLNSWLSKLDSKEVEITTYKMNLFLANLAMKMRYSDLEDPRMKDFISLAGSVNPFLDILTYSTGFISALFTSIGFSAIIMTIHPILLALIIVVIIVQMIVDKKMRKYQDGWRHETAPLYRKQIFLFNLVRETRFGKEIRMNSIESWILRKIHKFHEKELWVADKKNRKAVIRFNSFMEVVALIQQIFIYLYLGYRVVFHGMLLGDFSMYLTSIENFSDYISGLVGNYSLLLGTGLIAKEIRCCIEFSKLQDEKAEIKALDGFDKKNFIFEFKNVSFSYPKTEKMVLKNINLVLKPGESLSLVGANGAGKTTFVKLLCRFYEPTEGEILLNGININIIPYSEYINLISVVFQDYKIFAYSAEENITLSNNSKPGNLEKSIEKSGLKEKVDSLPKGINTMMSKEFDSEGVEFSGGEGQKVAIARAIYKDSPIIILDEPTSALDPIAEYEIYKRFFDLSSEKCAIYISHRLSSTRFTDKIAVFVDGYIIEYGNHIDLVKIKNGIYKKMFSTQAQYYL